MLTIRYEGDLREVGHKRVHTCRRRLWVASCSILSGCLVLFRTMLSVFNRINTVFLRSLHAWLLCGHVCHRDAQRETSNRFFPTFSNERMYQSIHMDMALNSSSLFAYVTCDCIMQVLADMDARDYARTRCLRVHVGWWLRARGRSHAHDLNEKKNTPYLANISSNSNALTRVVRNTTWNSYRFRWHTNRYAAAYGWVR